MSTLKVNKLRDTAGSTDAIVLDPNGGAVLAGVTTISTARITTGITTSIQVGGGVTISESGIEASGIGITCANINGGQIGGLKNKIINGDMRIAQRATSSTSITASNNGYQTMDRWTSYVNDAGTYTNTQATITDLPGFNISNKWEVTAADASAAANSYFLIGQTVERNNLVDLAKGTSSAKSTTLSFYVKCSITGSFGVELLDIVNSRHIAALYTIDSANTWERKVVTFPGDTTGTIVGGVAAGMNIFWWLHSGSIHNSGTLATSWATQVNANRAVGITNLGSTNGATWEITGAQFEIGDQATDFEYLDFDTQLSLCHRYFQKLTGGGNAHGVVGSSGQPTRIAQNLLKPMRAAPSVTVTGTLKFYDGSVTADYNAISAPYVNSNFAFDYDTDVGDKIAGSTFTHGRMCVAYSYSTAGGFECSSEL